jgi:hypothetical protein
MPIQIEFIGFEINNFYAINLNFKIIDLVKPKKLHINSLMNDTFK